MQTGHSVSEPIWLHIMNQLQPIIAILEKNYHACVPNGEIFWMDDVFLDEIRKMLQEADNDGKGYVKRIDVTSDDKDEFQDTIC